VAFGANLAASVELLKPSGVIASYASDAEPTPSIPFWEMLGKDLSVRFVLVYLMGDQAHRDAVRDISAILEQQPLKPVELQILPLAEIASAHEALETGHTAGKILLDPNR
jgi:NADPH2:quinone reductase